MADHSMSLVTIRDTTIKVFRAGSGPKLLLLHGAGGAESWLPYMARLAERHEVIVPQHPGFGGDGMPDWVENVGDMANFYLDFLAAERLDHVHLVGFSLGGWIAAELAVRNTTRLASLTLVGAAGLRVPGVAQVDIFACSDEQVIRDMFHDAAKAELAITHTLTPETEEWRLYNRITVAKLCWTPRLHDPNLAKWLHRIDVPTLLVWGNTDRIMPVEIGEEWHRRIPGSRLVVVPQCGHLPQAEQPDAFVTQLDGFVAEQGIAA